MRIGSAVPSLLALICSLTSGPSVAQSPSASASAPLTSFASSLHAHGIEISPPSLILALRNADPEIRSLAALKLAEDHDSDSIASIENSLDVEKNSRVKIDMAAALWGLNDPKGVLILQTMCSDSALPISLIVEVVQRLANINESSAPCADRVLGFLALHSDAEAREKAIAPLQDMYRWVPKNEADQILGEYGRMLRDKEPFVRMEASHALVQINAASSAGVIRTAISREKDPDIRASFQRDLDALEKKQ
jgi:hypothetical protein